VACGYAHPAVARADDDRRCQTGSIPYTVRGQSVPRAISVRDKLLQMCAAKHGLLFQSAQYMFSLAIVRLAKVDQGRCDTVKFETRSPGHLSSERSLLAACSQTVSWILLNVSVLSLIARRSHTLHWLMADRA
jgi:hypothetical protein